MTRSHQRHFVFGSVCSTDTVGPIVYTKKQTPRVMSNGDIGCGREEFGNRQLKRNSLWRGSFVELLFVGTVGETMILVAPVGQSPFGLVLSSFFVS